jgi:hypothetical protein
MHGDLGINALEASVSASPSSSKLTRQAFAVRAALIGVLALAALASLAVIPPMPQDPAYHSFADQRVLIGVPHCLNVVSNAPFIIFGLFGMGWLLRPSIFRSPSLFAAAWERWAFLTLFAFVAITGFGSSYYHLQPNNGTLFWDRLPLTVVLMTFFALIVAERVSPQLGPWLWPPLLAAGIFGVTYWHWTELHGAGDIRVYALVQYFPLLVIPILLLAFPARYYRTADLFAILGWYALAKVLEMADGFVYAGNGVVSGHTLKHLAASLGALWIVFLLRRRYTSGMKTVPTVPSETR